MMRDVLDVCRTSSFRRGSNCFKRNIGVSVMAGSRVAINGIFIREGEKRNILKCIFKVSTLFAQFLVVKERTDVVRRRLISSRLIKETQANGSI